MVTTSVRPVIFDLPDNVVASAPRPAIMEAVSMEDASVQVVRVSHRFWNRRVLQQHSGEQGQLSQL